MRKSTSIRHWYGWFISSMLSILLLAGCDTTVKTDMAEVGEATEVVNMQDSATAYKIDTAKSELTWIGAKMTGRHNGVFEIQEGQLFLQDGNLAHGTILINMANLRSSDKTLDEANNKKLTTHLKSVDFFDAEKYPTAVFEITAVEVFDSTRHTRAVSPNARYSEMRVKNPTHKITGNLTIKGVTKSVSFPAELKLEDNVLTAKANFNIDRTKWNLVYNSDQSLGNQTIHSDVNVGFNIVARQQ
ncbi:YceI family protein [Pontibacter harenae]|uniref:YceI family protein n=1 Tax=Pontibacter harenae TaxID=2894083 RepID=UPI001E6344D2|nr:YceI family protein [Pontibacter harenae]MCC9166464.1 YceI family protein [Pontibacter harenae]